MVEPESIFHDPLAGLGAHKLNPEPLPERGNNPRKRKYPKKARSSRARLAAMAAVSLDLARLASNSSARR